MGGKSSAPAAPDPNAVAAASTQTNDATAAYNKSLNLNNYSNPFGSQQSTQTGTDPTTGAPIYGTSISANPQLQQQLGSLLGQTGQSGATNASALSGLQGLQGQYSGIDSSLMGLGSQYAGLGSQLNQGQAAAAAQQGQNAAYAAQTQYLDPQYAQSGEALQSQLANEGLSPTSAAATNANTNYNNQKQQAYSNAANQAILTGSQIGAQDLSNQESGINTQAGLLSSQAGLYGQEASNLGAQGTNYGQQAGIGQLPYSNLTSLAGLVPGYSGTAQSSTSPANISGDIYSNYQAAVNEANASQSSSNSLLGGLFSLGGSALGAAGSAGGLSSLFSDRRLKKDIERVGLLRDGMGLYHYRYQWDAPSRPLRAGVMADEVRAAMPAAVHTHESGFDMVDYGQVIGA